MNNNTKDSKFEAECIDLGERKISKMNFSYIVTIPKKFIKITPYDKVTSVRIFLKGSHLTLVPSKAMHGDSEIEL